MSSWTESASSLCRTNQRKTVSECPITFIPALHLQFHADLGKPNGPDQGPLHDPKCLNTRNANLNYSSNASCNVR